MIRNWVDAIVAWGAVVIMGGLLGIAIMSGGQATPQAPATAAYTATNPNGATCYRVTSIGSTWTPGQAFGGITCDNTPKPASLSWVAGTTPRKGPQ